MYDYFVSTKRYGIGKTVDSYKDLLKADEDVTYDQYIEINLDELQPMINGSFTQDLAHVVGPEFKNGSALNVMKSKYL